MHLNEGRMNRQLEMKIGVIENAINKLIGIVSQITLDNQRLQRQIDQLKSGGVAPKGENTQTNDDNYELDISQVQKILKQQSNQPQSLGRRIDN